MRLSEFLRTSQQAIIAYSMDYAAKIPALSGSKVSLEILRDHLPLILDEIARDLEQPQTRAESVLKSRGLGLLPSDTTAAQLHGKSRAVSGLTIEQLVAEFRVLRSSVLRQWSDACTPDEFTSEDTMRFNEAIDQAVAESVAFFNAEVEHWRALLLGVVGHDLRGPLNGVLLTSEVLMREAKNTPFATRVEAIVRSGKRMGALLDSLLEYNKASLGTGMVLHLAPGDLVNACREELSLLRASLPDREITFTCPEECDLNVDFSRIREALANLVFNAAQHGVAGCAIDVKLEQSSGEVHLSVTNAAETIEPFTLQGLFEPLRQRALHRSGAQTRNLGLGLFIVRAIARAHGGDATAEMLDDGHVRFTVSIPRE
jgi:signal transduction histidine kinase